MNGYTSVNASITLGGHKKSLPAVAAAGVFLDLEVLSKAPARMIRSGLGDSLCRPTAQADWLLAHPLLERPYRTAPFALLADDEADLFSRSDALVSGDLEAMRRLARDDEHDIILLDIGLPDIDGYEVLIPNLVDTDPFHGGGLALPVRRAARRPAGSPDTEMAGKPRHAAPPPNPRCGPSRPTEDRHPWPAPRRRGRLGVPAPRRNPRLSGRPRMAVKWVRINETWYKPVARGRRHDARRHSVGTRPSEERGQGSRCRGLPGQTVRAA